VEDLRSAKSLGFPHWVVPAVCHVDGTARPRTVNKDENKTLYELIKAFKDVTDESIVLNTSINLAGEPLVKTPQGIIKIYAQRGLNAIYTRTLDKTNGKPCPLGLGKSLKVSGNGALGRSIFREWGVGATYPHNTGSGGERVAPIGRNPLDLGEPSP